MLMHFKKSSYAYFKKFEVMFFLALCISRNKDTINIIIFALNSNNETVEHYRWLYTWVGGHNILITGEQVNTKKKGHNCPAP